MLAGRTCHCQHGMVGTGIGEMGCSQITHSACLSNPCQNNGQCSLTVSIYFKYTHTNILDMYKVHLYITCYFPSLKAQRCVSVVLAILVISVNVQH